MGPVAPSCSHQRDHLVYSALGVILKTGSSRRAGGFSLVLRPTTTGGSFWEFDCFTVQKRSSFGTQSSPRRTFLAGRRSGRLEGRFPPARLLLPGGSQDNRSRNFTTFY